MLSPLHRTAADRDVASRDRLDRGLGPSCGSAFDVLLSLIVLHRAHRAFSCNSTFEAADAMSSRSYYTASFKRKVIVVAKETGNNLATARRYGVSEANVQRWMKDADRLQSCSGTRKAFSGPRKGRHPELEEELLTFVRNARNGCIAVTTEMVQTKAREIARQRGLSAAVFKASKHWVQRFMKRSGLSLRRRTSICQRLPVDFEEKLTSFQRYVIGLRRRHGYCLGQIGNADQTPIYFDMPLTRTVEAVGAKQVKVRTTGNEKQRVTVMLACTADGRRLPPYIIFSRKTLPKTEVFPRGAIIRCNDKGWMTAELFDEWIRLVWLRRPGALLSPRSMLVVDSFRGHTCDTSKALLANNKCDMVVIPGGMTSQLQPLDVCINKPFKDRVRCLYNEWMQEGDHALTPTGRLKRASLSQLVGWILDAWHGIPDTMVVRSFQKCGISNALDGSEDDLLWQEVSDKEVSSDSDSE